jgi:integrase
LFLETAKNHGLGHDYLMFLVLSFTGIRVGELVALKWKDVDFKHHTISITKTYYNPNNNTFVLNSFSSTKKGNFSFFKKTAVSSTRRAA